MRFGSFAKSVVALVVAVNALAVVHAQGQTKQTPPPTPKAQTATQFYEEYLAAFAKAKKIEDLVPFLSADRRKQVEATPASDRAKMFEMMKMLSATNVKVLKEEPGQGGKTMLTVEGLDSDKKKASGKVTVVKEDGAWKLGEESWKS
jgi:hypothetical protein